jgi:23S rRNA pseudouridine955/2504/2580 synthase
MTAVQTLTVSDQEGDSRLDRWFKRHFPQVTQGHLQKLLRTGQIRVEGKRAKADTRLEPGQVVRVPPLPEAPAPAPQPRFSDQDAEALRRLVLYRDEEVIVIDKPAGMAVQGGTGTTRHLDAMLDALRFGGDRPRLVHRLDKDTSGALVLARTLPAARALAVTFRGRQARKYYWAVTVGVPHPAAGRIDAPLAKFGDKGREQMAENDEGLRAVTLYKVVENAGKRAAWLALWPRTGRTHQLRVHCASVLGTPILGDGKYGGHEAFLPGAEVAGRIHLHARRIIIPHPAAGLIDVTAPLPAHMKETWRYFGFDRNDDGDPFAEID